MEKKKDQLIRQEKGRALSPFQEMDRYFDEFFHHPFALFRHPRWGRPPLFSETDELLPVADVFEEKNEVVIKLEIPGIDKKDIDITIHAGSLIISGEKKQEETVEEKNYHRTECSYGSFRRQFALPEDVDGDQAKASFKNGILEIRMPRSETAQKKQITID